MSTEMTLTDEQRRERKNAQARARRAAKALMKDENVSGTQTPVMVSAVSENAGSEESSTPVVKVRKPRVSTKVTVRDHVLNLLSDNKQRTTARLIEELQELHPGINESSIRVWVTDLRKANVIAQVSKEGRNSVLQLADSA